MPSSGEVYQAYLAVSRHFDVNSTYDIRKARGRLKGALNSPKAKNGIFEMIGRKVPTVGQVIALFVHFTVHNQTGIWPPNAASSALDSDPELPARLMHNLAKLDALIRPELMELAYGLSNHTIKIIEWIGLDIFNSRKCSLFDYKSAPELIVSIIEALDMWDVLMVQYKDSQLQMNLMKLYRYRTFLGDDLLRKAVTEVHRHIDVQGQKERITQILGKSQTKEKENEEWQALLMN